MADNDPIWYDITHPDYGKMAVPERMHDIRNLMLCHISEIENLEIKIYYVTSNRSRVDYEQHVEKYQSRIDILEKELEILNAEFISLLPQSIYAQQLSA